jgi:uncharacterized protein
LANYHTRIITSLAEVKALDWDALVAASHAPPFMRHAYLHAMHASGAACAASGWQPKYLVLENAQGELQAACPLYEKMHSYGEYVFDWAWANAYQQHGLPYYPKLLGAIPFTPVPAAKLLALDNSSRCELLVSVLRYADDSGVSSLHLLYLQPDEAALAEQNGMMLRHGVQFHWQNRSPQSYLDFDDFLSTLAQPKRKKIRQEERAVAEAGVSFELLHADAITPADWAFFYSCYSRTYYEHGNPPYLNEAFFQSVGQALPEMWLMIVAVQNGKRIASSLIALDPVSKRAYGRYWGAAPRVAHVNQLHFSACYYQPLRWCIANGYAAFEGGAQGEHKMARGLLPVPTVSAHWLAHPAFNDAVARFLEREGQGIAAYRDELNDRTPFKALP